MRIVRDVGVLRDVVGRARRAGKRIGFVPTMGYFHEGHLELVRRARAENDLCVVSIYVNPAQFGPKEDLARYPRNLRRDSSLLRKENVDILFNPADNTVYPQGYLTYIDVGDLAHVLCGAYRPGHFRGVATVVAKLLNMVQPDNLYLGAKDAQQVAVIKAMVRDLNVPVAVRVLPTVREPDGLAMSSRNVYLSARERAEAPVLYKALQMGADMLRQRTQSRRGIEGAVKRLIAAQSKGKIQYVACVDAHTLQPAGRLEGDIMVALAVFFGTTRLIDNVIVRLKRKNKD